MIDNEIGINTGPEAEREKLSDPTNTVLSDGSSLVYAFLGNTREDGVISNDEYNKAKDTFYRLCEMHPEAVRSCNGKSIEQVLDILGPYINEA